MNIEKLLLETAISEIGEKQSTRLERIATTLYVKLIEWQGESDTADGNRRPIDCKGHAKTAVEWAEILERQLRGR